MVVSAFNPAHGRCGRKIRSSGHPLLHKASLSYRRAPRHTHTHKRKQMTWPGPSLYREEPACPKLPAQLMTLQGIDSALCLLPQSRAACSRGEAPQELICESSPFPEQGTRPHTDLGAPRFLSLECSLHPHHSCHLFPNPRVLVCRSPG